MKGNNPNRTTISKYHVMSGGETYKTFDKLSDARDSVKNISLNGTTSNIVIMKETVVTTLNLVQTFTPVAVTSFVSVDELDIDEEVMGV